MRYTNVGVDFMSKYDALWENIASSRSEDFVMTYDEIKEITGFEIDHSFLKFKKELEEYGFRVKKISMKEKKVQFEKIR